MALLNELAVLQEQNIEQEANPSETSEKAYRLRQQRYQQITQDICKDQQFLSSRPVPRLV